MDSDVLASMYAQIVRGGVTKEQSHYVTDDESAAAWDAISAEVKAKRKSNPKVVFDVPAEIPGRPNTPVVDGSAPSTAPSDNGAEDEPAEEEPAEEEPVEEEPAEAEEPEPEEDEDA